MKIIVGIVTRGNDINYKLAEFLSRLSEDKSNEYFTPLLCRSPCSQLTGQEYLFKQLEGKNFDYAFITDSDVSCEQGVIRKLIEVGKDVVVGPVWMCDTDTSDIHLNVRLKSPIGNVYYPKEEGIELIEAASFSCMLLSKRVFDTFRDKGESYISDTTEYAISHPIQSDEIFFQKLGRFGIEAWIRWDIETIHYKVVDLSTKVVNRLMDEVIEYRSWDGRLHTSTG